MSDPLLGIPIEPDCGGFLQCIRRDGMPRRVHYVELFLDPEVQQAVCDRFGLEEKLDRADPFFWFRRAVEVQRFLGYDYVRAAVEGMDWPLHRAATDDTAGIQRLGGRSYVDEHRGPITNWEEFERYPWPDPHAAGTQALEWLQENLPEGMCVVAGGGFAHFAEYLTWLMGYETLCFALYDDRDLVGAIANRLTETFCVSMERVLAFPCVAATWGSDDMGFRGGTLIAPDDLRAFVLPGHRRMAEMSHAAGRPYLLHSCGRLDAIMPDLLDDVKIDSRHSFEDVIEPVTEAKARWGDRISLLGGIDVDFLCRADERAIRERVRHTLDVCMRGGGYCLGTGNSVANYIPLESYLTMLDEGRRYGA